MTTTRVGPWRAARSDRRAELDAMRTLVVVGLIFFHSALVFDSTDDFYVKNTQTTDVITIIAGLCVVWAMPLLFFIAGLGSWHSLRRRGAGEFAVERLRRLGVPLVVATLTIIPVPRWLWLRADPHYQDSYLRFLPRFFTVHLDLAQFPFIVRGRYFETGHLWFMVLLLAFSLMLAPLVRWVPRDHARRIGDRLAVATRRRGAILLPAMPLAVISAFVGLEKGLAGWSRWAYLLFFGYGFVLASDTRFGVAIRRGAVWAAVLGLALFAVGLLAFLAAGDAPDGDPFTDMTMLAIGARAFYGAAGWCWVVAIVGLLDRRRRVAPAEASATARPNKATETRAVPETGTQGAPNVHRRAYGYLAAAVLPLYILHQPIVVAVAYGVVGWDASITVKYVVIALTSLALAVAAYDLLIRRTRVTRFLSGMRD